MFQNLFSTLVKTFFLIAALVAAWIFFGTRCSRPKPLPPLSPGAFYSIKSGKSEFKVAKYIGDWEFEGEGIVYLLLYKNKYGARPAQIDPLQLELSTLNENNSQEESVPGHFPIRRITFAKWEPQFIQPGTVASDEKTAMDRWKTARNCQVYE